MIKLLDIQSKADKSSSTRKSLAFDPEAKVMKSQDILALQS